MIHYSSRPILYVDDTEEQRYAMRRILETAGYRVLEAGTGAEALSMIDRQPALVILDVKLPDIGGYEVCRRIKSISPDTPVLQVSASFSDPTLRASGLSGGADAYIAQPVYPAELVSLVKALIRSAESDAALRFLATTGPLFSRTLDFPEVIDNICNAVVPQAADECIVYLSEIPGQMEPYWSVPVADEAERVAIVTASRDDKSSLVNEKLLVAPLPGDRAGFGTIAFRLTGARQYTSSDCSIAEGIASRAGLAVQNSLLFALEQSTRAALVHAEKLAAAGRLTAAIAHELNNPLEAVTNLVFLIQTAETAPPEVRNFATTALSELARVAHIARQTLGFYRELVNPVRFDLNESIQSTLELYEHRMRAKNIALTYEFGSGVEITAIKGEIRQLLSNLIVNAMDAVDSNGKIKVKSELKGDTAVVSISDTGSGIPPSVLPRIFDPFYTTKVGTGTGLGLWVSDNIARKHGGQIVASSPSDEPGYRTTFEATMAVKGSQN